MSLVSEAFSLVRTQAVTGVEERGGVLNAGCGVRSTQTVSRLRSGVTLRK